MVSALTCTESPGDGIPRLLFSMYGRIFGRIPKPKSRIRMDSGYEIHVLEGAEMLEYRQGGGWQGGRVAKSGAKYCKTASLTEYVHRFRLLHDSPGTLARSISCSKILKFQATNGSSRAASGQNRSSFRRMSQERSSSGESCRHPNCKFKTTTGKCLVHVTLNEVFDNGDSTTAAADRFSDRVELPNEILNVHLNVPGVLMNGFRRELAADGLDLIVENGNLTVSGFAPRNNYNGKKEVVAKMAKFLTNSKSFP